MEVVACVESPSVLPQDRVEDLERVVKYTSPIQHPSLLDWVRELQLRDLKGSCASEAFLPGVVTIEEVAGLMEPFVGRLHGHQTHSGLSYVEGHLKRVVALVSTIPGDVFGEGMPGDVGDGVEGMTPEVIRLVLVLTAWLHDVLEDGWVGEWDGVVGGGAGGEAGEVRLRELRVGAVVTHLMRVAEQLRGRGVELPWDYVVAAVGLLTDEKGPRRITKPKTLAAIYGAIQHERPYLRLAGLVARLVKVADRLANIRSCVAAGDSRLAMYRREGEAFEAGLYGRDGIPAAEVSVWLEEMRVHLWPERFRRLERQGAPYVS